MIITKRFYNNSITGEGVSEKEVQRVEPSDTINDISEYSHLTTKQIMAHLEGYFDGVSIKSPEVTMAELSHFIPRTTDELCEFVKLYIPGDDILLRINQEQTVTKYCESDVKATEETLKNMCDDVHDEFSKYMNPPVSDISVTTKPEK